MTSPFDVNTIRFSVGPRTLSDGSRVWDVDLNQGINQINLGALDFESALAFVADLEKAIKKYTTETIIEGA